MSELFGQLGIDWRLLLSQAINFFLLLFLLRLLVYRPLLKLLRERREKIELGLAKADEAEKRLTEVNLLGKERLKEAEKEASNILKATELKAKEYEEALLAKAKDREAAERQSAAERIKAEEIEASRLVKERSAELVKSALVKLVDISPEAIDEALVKRAVNEAGRIE